MMPADSAQPSDATLPGAVAKGGEKAPAEKKGDGSFHSSRVFPCLLRQRVTSLKPSLARVNDHCVQMGFISRSMCIEFRA